MAEKKVLRSPVGGNAPRRVLNRSNEKKERQEPRAGPPDPIKRTYQAVRRRREEGKRGKAHLEGKVVREKRGISLFF